MKRPKDYIKSDLWGGNVKAGKPGPWCFDCGLDYEEDWPGDFVIRNHIWAEIKPFKEHKEGLLCPNCMISRLKEVGYSGTIWGPKEAL